MQTVKADISAIRTKEIASSFEGGINDKRLIASRIATIHDVAGDTYEYKVYGGKASTTRTGATATKIKDAEAYNTEFEFDTGGAKTFTVEVTDSVHTSETTDKVNEMFHDPSISAAERKEAIEILANDFDRKVVNDGYDLASAIAGGADVTDAASAKAAAKLIKKTLEGYRGTSLDDIQIVVNTNTKEFFEDLIEARVTNAGDNVLINGVVEKVYGMDLISTRKYDTSLTLATGAVAEDATKLVLDDGKLLIVAKKKLKVAKKALVSEEAQAPSSAAGLINIQKVLLHIIFMKTYVKVNEADFVLKNA